MAKNLMLFGVPDVDLDDCVAALAARGDNMDAAANLLFDPGAMAQLRAERVRRASEWVGGWVGGVARGWMASRLQ
jgi:hypothetical protein